MVALELFQFTNFDEGGCYFVTGQCQKSPGAQAAAAAGGVESASQAGEWLEYPAKTATGRRSNSSALSSAG